MQGNRSKSCHIRDTYIVLVVALLPLQEMAMRDNAELRHFDASGDEEQGCRIIRARERGCKGSFSERDSGQRACG